MKHLTTFIAADKSGLQWYKNAYLLCEAQAQELGMEVWKFVAIVAVISPKCPWEKNILYARNLVLKQGPQGALGPNVRKAKVILKLKTQRALFNHLRGPKVTSFYWNIMRQGYDTNVTIDTHMKQLFEPERAGVGKAVYRRITDAILLLARTTGYAPAQVQAVLWEHQRNNTTESGYHN